MKLTRLLKYSIVVCALAFYGCDDDHDHGAGGSGGAGAEGGAGGAGGAGAEGGAGGAGAEGGAGGAGAEGGAGGAGGAPEMPALAPVQIDRAGRSAVSTALIAPFEPNDETKGAAKDAYNAAGQADFAAQAAEIGPNMAIYDALDTVCGNAAFYAADTGYTTFATVVADDRLWVNTASDSCGVYLAVEANATGLLENNDCGGRRPVDDTIDITLSLLANGSVSDVGDGIAADNVEHPADFPWLAAPVE